MIRSGGRVETRDPRADQPFLVALGPANRRSHRDAGDGAERGLEPPGKLAGGAFGGVGVADDAALSDRLATQLELRLEQRDEISATRGDQSHHRRNHQAQRDER